MHAFFKNFDNCIHPRFTEISTEHNLESEVGRWLAIPIGFLAEQCTINDQELLHKRGFVEEHGLLYQRAWFMELFHVTRVSLAMQQEV